VTPAELRALAEAATPGPWEWQTDSRGVSFLVSKPTSIIVADPALFNPQDEELVRLAPDLALLCAELGEAARPFGEFAQELLNGHPTGRLAPGVLQALLDVLAKLDELEGRDEP